MTYFSKTRDNVEGNTRDEKGGKTEDKIQW